MITVLLDDLRVIPGANYVKKGWGYEKWIVNTPEYCGKILHIDRGRRCSWHYHAVKDETFYVQSGAVMIFISDEDDVESAKMTVLHEGDALHIPPGTRHYFRAIEDTDVFEFSTHHDDADSIRIKRGD